MRQVVLALVAVALVGCGGKMMGDHKAAGHDQHVLVQPGEMKWGAAPDGLPPGAKAVVLHGDPKGTGVFAIRALLPAGYKIPAHTHPSTENVTVISGTLFIGSGDKLDESKATRLPAGGFVSLPPGHQHFAFVREETVIQVHAKAPWGIKYVNPDDDPRKAK